MSNFFGSFLSAQIWQLPFLVVYVTGFVFAINGKWQGKFQGLAAWGFGLLLLTWVLQAANHYLMYSESGLPMREMLSGLGWIVIPLIDLVGIILVGAAVFADRQKRA